MLYIGSSKTYAATCTIYERRDALAITSLCLPQVTPVPNFWGFSVALRLARFLDQTAATLGGTNVALEQRLEKMRAQSN